eukprot:95807-Lingulodinium_polyedra.AAC.1
MKQTRPTRKRHTSNWRQRALSFAELERPVLQTPTSAALPPMQDASDELLGSPLPARARLPLPT